MDANSQRVFLLLVIAQAAHSIEEYWTALYDVLAPARFISGILTSDLELGFALVNAAIVAFAFWCWLVPIRRAWRSARSFAWFWTLLEFANGTGHVLFAASAGGYFPGALTAPALIAVSVWLGTRLLSRRQPQPL